MCAQTLERPGQICLYLDARDAAAGDDAEQHTRSIRSLNPVGT
jgi:hypothetical protein